MMFFKTDPKEQETVINFDYYAGLVTIYTCRKKVYERIYTRLGEPKMKKYTNRLLCAGIWEIPFNDYQSITRVLSRPVLIGNIKRDKS